MLFRSAFLISGLPETGQYFVYPDLIAETAASLILSGVSKSGSPVPKLIMSIPCCRKALALASIANVGEGLIARTLLERYIFRSPNKRRPFFNDRASAWLIMSDSAYLTFFFNFCKLYRLQRSMSNVCNHQNRREAVQS